MNISYRRYEMLLPLQLNDGTVVDEELIGETLLELENPFGAGSSESQVIHGRWRHQGESYADNLMRVFVDVPDTNESREYFREFKERLKERFQQIEIWLTTYPIDVV